MDPNQNQPQYNPMDPSIPAQPQQYQQPQAAPQTPMPDASPAQPAPQMTQPAQSAIPTVPEQPAFTQPQAQQYQQPQTPTQPIYDQAAYAEQQPAQFQPQQTYQPQPQPQMPVAQDPQTMFASDNLPHDNSVVKKSGGGKKVAIIVGVILLVLAIPAVALILLNSGNDTPQQPAVDQTSVDSVADSELAEQTNEPAKTAINKSFALKVSGITTPISLDVKATDFIIPGTVEGVTLPEDSNELILIGLSVKNKVKDPFNLRSSSLKLKSGGQELASINLTEEQFSNLGLTEYDFNTDIKKGKTATGYVAYAAPKGANGYELSYRFQANVFGGDDIDKTYKIKF